MKIDSYLINISSEFSLRKEEVEFLKLFLNNREKPMNLVLMKDIPNLTNLSSLGLIYNDPSTYNIHLTKIGNLVLDQFDRDKKIKQILDE